MKSIIERIYENMLETDDLYPIREQCGANDELLIHDELFKTLTDKQQVLFNKFIDLLEMGNCNMNDYMYHLGFKTGVLLMLEVVAKD